MNRQRLAVDIIIERDSEIVLIERANEPFKGMLAIPGGFVEFGERVEETAEREAEEETGIKVKLVEILGVYSDPKRDPRGHTIAVVFVAQSIAGELKAGDDAARAKWFKLSEIEAGRLGFDHAKILEDYRKWKVQRGTWWSGK